MKFIIQIANKHILIQSIYSGVYHTCKEYLVDEKTKPDFELSISEEMIAEECERIKQHEGQAPSLKLVENLLVHRLIAEYFLDHNAVLMHGAVIAFNQRAYMFTGKSGTGKTTHIKKWLKNSNDVYVVNGDKPLILIEKGKVFACGMPWCGKEALGRKAVVPLQSIVFMRRSDVNKIEPVSYKNIFPFLLEQTYRPKDAEMMKKTLRLLMHLKDNVSFYVFHFNNFLDDAFTVPYEVLTNEEMRQ